MDKGKDKWAEVIKYLRSTKRDPKKVLNLLRGNEKGNQSNYNISRSSYTLNIIAVITQKIQDAGNKNKNFSRVVRDWVKSDDFKSFYNLMRLEENLKYKNDEEHHRLYTKQIKDLWYSKTKEVLKWKKYFKETGGVFYVKDMPNGKNISSNTFPGLQKKRS